MKCMSWLFIDTTRTGICRFGMLEPDGSGVITRAFKADRLLTHIAQRIGLEALQRTMSGVCVVAGPGSFSAVRSGVLVANLLARFLHTPLIGISVTEAQDLGSVAQHLEGLKQMATFVAPVYDAEPNITQPARV